MWSGLAAPASGVGSSRVGVEGSWVRFSGLQTSHVARDRGDQLQGWAKGGQGSSPALGSLVQPSSSAASTSPCDLGRRVGRGSPRHVLPAGQSPTPGVQHRLPHALSLAISEALWPTPQPCPSPGEEWWAFSFSKHSPLRTKESLGTPEIPMGVRRLMLSYSSLEGHEPP